MSSDPRRVLVLLAVGLLHLGLATVVVVALRYHHDATAEPVTALVFFELPPSAPEVRTAPHQASFVPQPSTAITLPPLSGPQPGAVDWDAEGRSAAAEATGTRRTRRFGQNPATEAAPAASSPDVAVHHAGEEYREADGSSIVFVSDRCFVASDAVPPGTPDIIARARPTRTVCWGDPGWSRADLFKDLPAYRRYHPEAGASPERR